MLITCLIVTHPVLHDFYLQHNFLSYFLQTYIFLYFYYDLNNFTVFLFISVLLLRFCNIFPMIYIKNKNFSKTKKHRNTERKTHNKIYYRQLIK